jgi:hypothetical protein
MKRAGSCIKPSSTEITVKHYTTNRFAEEDDIRLNRMRLALFAVEDLAGADALPHLVRIRSLSTLYAVLARDCPMCLDEHVRRKMRTLLWCGASELPNDEH